MARCFAQGISIDGGHFQRSMPHPFAEQIHRNAFGDGRYPKAMPQAFGAFMRVVLDACFVHHLGDDSPGCGSGPFPWTSLICF